MNCNRFLELTERNIGDVCIFGAGDYGSTWCYELLKDAGFNVVCYIDNYKIGGRCNNLQIYSFDYLEQHKELFVFISTRGKAEDEMVRQVKKIGIVDYYHFESDYAPVDLAQYLYKLGDDNLIKKYPSIMDDEAYLKIRFKYRMGYELNLEHPKTFNEKLNWMKINDRNSLYSTMVDKYAVKSYVSKIIGEEHVVPLYGVWEKFEDIDFKKLPSEFVLKCSHNCGKVIICKNKDDFNIELAKSLLNSAIGMNAFWADREWPYKMLKPLIIAEKYIESNEDVLVVYKFFCFHGEPFMVQVIQNDKTPKESIDYFDLDWKFLELRQNFPNSKEHVKRPQNINQMLEICRKLSAGIPFVRVDLFLDINDNIYFSEYTFFSDSGCEKFYPDKWDRLLGDLIILKG